MQEHEKRRSELAQRAAKMRLGYGTLDLIDPTPVKLHFGKWNNRPIESLRVKEIVKQLLFKGVWDWESPIPVVVPRRFIKVEALQAHRPEGTRAPPIVFTDEAREQIIELAGGHHRQRALIEYRATLDKSRETLTSKIAQLGKRKASEETDEALATLRKRLAEVEETLAQPMLWLTEVFAAGEWRVCVRAVETVLFLTDTTRRCRGRRQRDGPVPLDERRDAEPQADGA